MSISSDIKTWTVLVVDDEPDNLAVVEKVLTFHGARVLTAQDGRAGLDVLQRTRPTFILLDLSMATMDGWEMCKRIRENPVYSTLPVIALTAHAMDGDKERVMSAGFDGYMSKPYRLMTFLSDIQKCLQRIPPSRFLAYVAAGPMEREALN